jgi:hypothetical protein
MDQLWHLVRNFRKNGELPSLYDVAVSWLRLQTPIDCIPHPYWIYTKCLSTLRCCDGHMGMHLCRITCAGGGEFEGKWGMAEPVWCCGVMVEAANPHWLHPTSMLDVYKVFEDLEMLWMGIWVHPYAFNTSCRWGWIWGEMGYGRACMTHIHIGCIKSVWAPKDAVDGYMGTPSCRITCAGGGEFEGKWGLAKPVWCCGVMVEAANPQRLHPTSMLDV